ncbi:hypothetical protein JAAARDRAFT_184595 [Jaapia argillacea MUCL 33604]|uniref:Cytochrome P450 n=1 Tax=Jaapia argillacea MUCL 33604 TaxID=933084 RepID=A0A067PDW5_9AGAM|nr:hypothetical protein JAAARDRAFT_184595 [Jaapia argillacea MUCL 33604]
MESRNILETGPTRTLYALNWFGSTLRLIITTESYIISPSSQIPSFETPGHFCSMSTFDLSSALEDLTSLVKSVDIASLTTRSNVAIGVLALSTYAFLVQPVLFHPLSSFPGPPLAKITTWYKALKSQDGEWTNFLRQWHEKTGSNIIRIAPNWLSFWDPDAYKEIYTNVKLLKDDNYYSAFNIPSNHRNVFTHTLPSLHTPLRKGLSPLFTRQSIVSLEPLFHEQLELFVARLTEMANSPTTKAGEPPIVNLFMAFRCLTTDIIAVFAFGRSFGCLHAPGFDAPVLVSLDNFLTGGYIRLHFPRLVRFFEYLPIWLQPVWQRGSGQMHAMALHALNAYRAGEKTHKYPILFSQQLELGSVLDDDEICCAANLFVGAGGDTSGTTLSVGSYYIGKNPAVQNRLFAELKAAYPDKEDVVTAHWADLEKLPYLTACVMESLRISGPIPGDLPRVVPKEGWEFKGVKIPPGTVVSSSSTAVHLNPVVFPEPDVFKPERWLDGKGKLKEGLDVWLVSFSKGRHSCLGQNMGMAELYIFTAAFYRLFEIEVVNKPVNVELRDFFTAVPVGHDIRAKVKCRKD